MYTNFVKDCEYIPIQPQIFAGPCCQCVYYDPSKLDNESHVFCTKYNMYTTHDRTCKSFKKVEK